MFLLKMLDNIWLCKQWKFLFSQIRSPLQRFTVTIMLLLFSKHYAMYL